MSVMKDRLFTIAAIIILLLLFLHPIDADGDFFQHVNIGRYIVTHHTLSRIDDLTFTAAGKPYIGYAWLAGLLFYGIYSSVGAIGINLLVLLTALLTFFLLYRYLQLIKVPKHIAILTVLLVSPVVATRWPSRPEIFLYPILLGFLLLDEGKKDRPRLVWMYPLLMLLLVNLYGSSFPAAAALLILLAIKNWFAGKRRLDYYAAIAICFPAALLNGYGLKSLFFITLIPKMTYLWGDWVGLWQILKHPEFNFAWEITILYLVFTFMVIGLSLCSIKQLRRHISYTILALSIFVPFGAVRLRALVAILAAPLIGLLLSHMKSRLVIGIVAFVALCMAALFIVTNPPGVGEFRSIFPPQLIQFIKNNHLSGRVFNTPRIGSFLSYYLAPQIKTFSDTRDDLFIGTGALEAEQTFLSQGASVSYLIRKYRIDLVVVNLTDGNSFHDLVYDTQWALVYFADNYCIFVPRNVAIAKHLSIIGNIDPYAPNGVKKAL